MISSQPPLKIVLFGPESTGKTFLAESLARHYNTLWVPEFARSYLENKRIYYDASSKHSNEICMEEDIPPIVIGQTASEEAIGSQAEKLLFLDTNPLQTQVYVGHYYQKKYDWLDSVLENRKYDFYLLTNVDIPWQPDPLRDRPDQRSRMFDLFKKALDNRRIDYSVVEGDFETRIKMAIEIVDMLLK